MGKQARLKQARRDQRVQSRRSAGPARSGSLFWIGLAALVAVAAAVAVFVGRDDGGSGTVVDEAASASVEGVPLPAFDADASADPAVGMSAPGLAGTSVNDGRVTIPAGAGQPRALIFLAHWCPHCRDEVPLIVDWVQAGGGPEGVELYGVATANDPDADNYPASAWLEEEGWEVPTLLDDDQRAAAQAYGVTGFPFFVFVDGEGEVTGRHAGELGIDELEERLAALAPGA
jgi:cytochrome c biogenesis protein CcmG, thiol:disulfide interchange protein DsbE